MKTNVASERSQTPTNSQKGSARVDLDPWGVEWQCYLNWFAVVVTSLVIVVYLQKEVSEECWKQKKIVLYFSYAISFITIVEAILMYAGWILNLWYHFFQMDMVCFLVILGHCSMAFANFVLATISLMLPSCLIMQTGNMQLRYKYNTGDPIRQFVLKYETKVVGILQVMLAVMLVASAMYLAKERIDHKMRSLYRRGLLLEYYNIED